MPTIGFFVSLALGLVLAQGLLFYLLFVALRRSLVQEPIEQQVARTLMQQQLTQLLQDHSGVQHKLDELLRALQSAASNQERRQEAQGDSLSAALALHRQESISAFQGFQAGLLAQLGQGQTQLMEQLREQLRQFFEGLAHQHHSMQTQLSDIRGTVEQRLVHLQDDNAKRLEQMRATVDEKLQSTLEARLGASFKQVSERLEEVYKGLGEMQALATGVGDLKRVLTNVKTRGTWGEVQLQALLEQMLTPSQYACNVKPVPGSAQVVEFAVRLPGQDEHQPVWLPIDAKFPKEQYERLLDAFDRADPEAAAQASKALEQVVRKEAQSMAEKYLAPPHTTDFGILFLPTEGLYAEIVKRPGLVDDLQRQYRITVAGPVTLSTLLNALQLGFKTLALEKRSSEVWSVLGAVKTEFGKFSEVLAKTRESLERAAKHIEHAETRTRAMGRKLKDVDQMPEAQAGQLLGLDGLKTALPVDDDA